METRTCTTVCSWLPPCRGPQASSHGISRPKAGRIAQALGLEAGTDLGEALAGLIQAVGLTKSYRELGYRMTSLEKLMIDIGDSPFNRTSPYVPSQGEYRSILEALIA